MTDIATPYLHLILVVAAAFTLTGCASQVDLVRDRYLDVSVATSSARTVRVLETVTIDLPTGYVRQLESGSEWEFVGRIPEGDVYEKRQGVFTVEGRHVYEAYLVLSRDHLHGFYLPVEQAYVSLSQEIPLALKHQTQP